MPVTQKEIAERLGVSQPLVGQALLGRKGMSEELRARILATAHEMGYTPNAAARSLRTGTTHNVVFAYIRPSLGSPASWMVPTKLAEELAQMGFRLESKYAPTNEALIETLENVVRDQSADLFILWGVEPDVAVQAAYLESEGQPFIARGYYEEHPEWCQVDFDHCGMMRQSVEKLIELGHERIALFNHGADQPYARNFRRTFDEIIMQRFGRATPPEWLLTSYETEESGLQIGAQIKAWSRMPSDRRPTALAVGEIGSMAHVLDILMLSNGIRIGDAPGLFSVAGVRGPSAGQFVAGPTWIFDADTEERMIDQMIARQITPLLRGEEPQERRLRHLPRLHNYTPAHNIWDSAAFESRRAFDQGEARGEDAAPT